MKYTCPFFLVFATFWPKSTSLSISPVCRKWGCGFHFFIYLRSPAPQTFRRKNKNPVNSGNWVSPTSWQPQRQRRQNHHQTFQCPGRGAPRAQHYHPAGAPRGSFIKFPESSIFNLLPSKHTAVLHINAAQNNAPHKYFKFMQPKTEDRLTKPNWNFVNENPNILSIYRNKNPLPFLI